MTRRRVVPVPVSQTTLGENLVLMRSGGIVCMKCVGFAAPEAFAAGERKDIASIPEGWRPPLQMCTVAMAQRAQLGRAYFNRTGEVSFEAAMDIVKGAALTFTSISWPVQ